MAARRSTRPGKSDGGAAPAAPPLWNMGLVVAAVGSSIYLLVDRGAMTWPPRTLLRSLTTMVGCLTLIGPLVLWKRAEDRQGSLGELVWITTGFAFWAFDLIGAVRGEAVRLDWSVPLPPRTIGVVALCSALAGWRIARLPMAWTWTGMLGTILGIFWIAMAVLELAAPGVSPTGPDRPRLFSSLIRP